MKKSLFFMMLLVSFAGFSQAISVNTTQYTAEQLVNDVLISSPCTSGQNVVARTGTDFGSTNGIGYFQNTSSNPNFPFSSGVVLSTGDVSKIPGVNPATPNTTTLSDGNLAWTGDTDLQNILLSQSGIAFNSINASYLEFDFTPLSANFSFDFVFASEEYGALQCNFSDAFAFILTDLTTGVSKNLAVVAGNSPISVATIRNNLYNANCASVNAGFFGAYNGSGFGPAINFNGQTIKMTASSVVDVTHAYKIKLVIADGVDSNNNPSPLYDSAVFFGANTFNIGTEVLGLDYTATNATATPPRDAICQGGIMPTLAPVTPLPAGTIYKWLKDGAEFVPAQTGPTLNLQALGENSTHTYTLIYTKENCQPISDLILVEVYSPIGAPNPINLYKSCEASSPTHSFDLGINTTLMMAGLPANTIITYHASQANADSGANPLAIPHVITHVQAVAGVTIYARIKSGSSPCFETKSFTLKYVNMPTINIPNPADAALTKCATNYPAATPRANFSITALTNLVLGSPPPADASAFAVKFYLSWDLAHAGTTNPIGNLNSQTTKDLFVRIELIGNPSCFVELPASQAALTITVTPKAPIETLENVLMCSTSTGYQLPALTEATAEYWTAADGPDGTGTELDTPAETLITDTQAVFIYNDPGTGLCSNESTFSVVKVDLNDWVTDLPTTPVCTSYTLPPLPYGMYLPNMGPPSASNVEIAPGTVINATTNLYLYVESIGITPACTDNIPFTINITPFTPIEDSNYPNQFDCTSYILGTNMTANPQVTYWTGPNQTGVQKFFGDAINTNNTTIYVHQQSGTCTNDDVSFVVYIGAAGNLNVPGAPVVRCNGYSLTASPIGEYHTDSFQNGGGTQLFPGPNGQVAFNEVGTNTYYLYVPGEPCTYNISFTVTNQLATMPEIADVPAQCDFYILPPNPYPGASYYEGLATNNVGTGTFVADANNTQNYVVTGEGVHHFYLHIDGPGNGCQENEEFTVTINNTPIVDVFADAVAECNTTTYTLPTLTQPGGFYNQPDGVDPIVGGTITQLTSAIRTVYVYQAGSTPGTCDGEDSFTVSFSVVNVEDVADKYTCDVNYFLPPIVGAGDYYDAPGGPAGTGNKITLPYSIAYTGVGGAPQTTTLYVYADDGAAVPCRDEDTFTVTQYAKPVITVPAPVNQCGSFTLPAYNTIVTTPPNAVNHYYTGDDGTGTELFPGDQVAVATPIYLYAAVVAPDATLACFTDEVWNINVTPFPVITPAVATITNTGCDSVTLPPLTVGTYYNDLAHTDQITNLTLTASQTVYVYAENNPGNCGTADSFDVTITTSPVITINDADATLEVCDSYTLPPYNDPLFSTNVGTVNHYYLSSGAEVFPGNTINTSDVITIGAINGTCTNVTPVTLTVNISVTPILDPVGPIAECDHYQLPALTVGNYYNDLAHTDLITNTDLTSSQTVYVYAESPTNPNCNDSDSFSVTITNTPVLNPAEYAEVFACDGYTLPALTTPGAGYFSGTNGTGPIPAGTTYTTDTTVYVYAINGACDTQEILQIHIYKVDEIADFTGCFDTYPLPPLTIAGANYYTGPNGTGTMMSPGMPITSTQTVYVYGNGPSGCASETSFLITKLSPAVANPVTDPALTTVCDSDANPDDFVTMIDLDAFTASVLGSQSPTEYTVSYYASAIDAQMQTNAITTDGTTAPDAAYNPIFTRVQNATGCHSEGEILINVVPQPHIDADLSGIICIDPDTGEITPAYIESGYPGGNGPGSYSFEWTDADGLVVATTPNLQTTEAGTYTLVIRANGVSMCESAPITATIIESARPASVAIETIGWFTDRQTITVVATPYIGTSTANFLYSLDGQEPQADPVFTDVPGGVHEILVSDINGCGATPAPFSVELVSSPPYFTPNGDGINDVWRLNGMANIPTGSVSQIQIFDRYGKLVTQITADGPGWDGNLNGQPLPATDYWFSLKYVDPATGNPKEFKSHFSLVR